MTAAVTLLTAATATAQNRAAGRQAQGGGAAGGGTAVVRDVLKDLNLTYAQKQKIEAVLTDAQTDIRESTQSLRDASPEERRDTMREIAKKQADAKAKVEAELTPEQKVQFAQRFSAAYVDRASANVKAATTAAGSVDLTDDEKAKFKSAADEATKSLDGTADAVKAVKDDAGAEDVQKQVQQIQQTFRRAVVEAVGRDKATELMRATLRQAGGRGGQGRTATTKPAKAD